MRFCLLLTARFFNKRTLRSKLRISGFAITSSTHAGQSSTVLQNEAPNTLQFLNERNGLLAAVAHRVDSRSEKTDNVPALRSEHTISVAGRQRTSRSSRDSNGQKEFGRSIIWDYGETSHYPNPAAETGQSQLGASHAARPSARNRIRTTSQNVAAHAGNVCFLRRAAPVVLAEQESVLHSRMAAGEVAHRRRSIHQQRRLEHLAPL
jgi:hypothetical protein